MAREYHNLQGWLRDVRRAIEGGHQLAYEAAELIIELDDLVDQGTDGNVPGLEVPAGEPDDDAADLVARPDASDELLGVQGPGRVGVQSGDRPQAGLRADQRSTEGNRAPGRVAGGGANRRLVGGLTNGS